MPLKVLGEWYALLKNLIAIFEVKEKELLVITKLLNITTNRPSEVKGIGNTIYLLKINYILK